MSEQSDTDTERQASCAEEGSGQCISSFHLQAARWLLLPVLFVVAHWSLLLLPGTIKKSAPVLWTPATQAPDAFFLPTPKNRSQAFDLGGTVMFFTEHCKEDALDGACKDMLKKAAEILGADRPLTAKELLGQRSFLIELDGQRSVADRVAGFFSFVNILWLVGIVGIVATIVPCLAFLMGPMLARFALVLFENVLRPAAMMLHSVGAWEMLAYFLAFLLSVEGSRYPPGADAGMMVSLTGGLLFLPCWLYSTSLHMDSSGGNKDNFLMLSHFMFAVIMVPLALIHQSSMIGFFAVLAVYGGLGFIFLAFGFGFRIGFDSKDALNRCILASVTLIIVFTSFRVLGRSPSWVLPFLSGGMCLGNVMYFLGLLIATGGWRRRWSDWWKMQVVMALSLFFALLVGCVYAIPAMTNTACTFLVLWMMEKQREIDFQGFQPVVVFLNCVGIFLVSLWLNHHPEFIIAMFDGRSMYS